MKQAAYLSLRSVLVLALLLSPSLSRAQQENEGSPLKERASAIAKTIGRPAGDICFDGLRLIPDKLGAIVCGTADGRRFLAGASKPPSPRK